jgi:hypothetical protein
MDRDQHSRPLWIGLIASIAFVPLVAALLTAFSSQNVMVPWPLVLIMGLLIAAPVGLLVELPLVLWLRKIGRLSVVYLCMAGALAGAVALGLYSLQANYWPQMRDQDLARWAAQQAALRALLPGGIYGLLSAAAFSVGAGLTVRSSGRRGGIS